MQEVPAAIPTTMAKSTKTASCALISALKRATDKALTTLRARAVLSPMSWTAMAATTANRTKGACTAGKRRSRPGRAQRWMPATAEPRTTETPIRQASTSGDESPSLIRNAIHKLNICCSLSTLSSSAGVMWTGERRRLSVGERLWEGRAPSPGVGDAPDTGAKGARCPQSPGSARTAAAGSRRTKPDGPGPLFFSCASRPSSLPPKVKIVNRARPVSEPSGTTVDDHDHPGCSVPDLGFARRAGEPTIPDPVTHRAFCPSPGNSRFAVGAPHNPMRSPRNRHEPSDSTAPQV